VQKKVQKLQNLINVLDRKIQTANLSHSQTEGWANFCAQFKMGRLEARDIVVGCEIAIAVGHNKKANDILIIAYDLMPTSFIVLEALVQTFRNLSQDKTAENLLRKYLDENPDNWDVTRLLGRLYFHTDQKDKHVELVTGYIVSHPNHVAARIELATQKLTSHAPDIEQSLLDILAIEAHNLYALSQLVQYYAKSTDFTCANTYLEKVQRLYPDEALTRFCEGFIYEVRLDFDKALKSYDQALNINSHFIEAYGKSGEMMHKLGLDLEEAWYRLEARFPQLLGRPDGPFWRGESLTGKYLIIWAEQGLGDQLSFASMLRDLPNDIGRVDVECDEKLVPFFKRSYPEYNVYPRRAKRPGGHDFHSPIGAIARYLRPSYESFTKTPIRHLIPDEKHVVKWKEWIDGLGSGLKVGLCWRSGVTSVVRKRDAIDLCDDLTHVLKMKDVVFINLMYGEGDDELNLVQEKLGVHIHQPPNLNQFEDVDQTAALIKTLDVTVGVATSPIGLAQAVGCDNVLLYSGDPGELAPLWWPGTTYFNRSFDEDWTKAVEQLHCYLENHPDRK